MNTQVILLILICVAGAEAIIALVALHHTNVSHKKPQFGLMLALVLIGAALVAFDLATPVPVAAGGASRYTGQD